MLKHKNTDPVFDYGILDAETAEAAKGYAHTIRTTEAAIQKNVLIAGQALRAAKAKLKHGEWFGWLTAECGLSDQTARNYMKAAKLVQNLPTDKSQTILDLPAKTLYALAAPTTPTEVKEEVIAKAMAGEKLNHDEVAEKIEQAKPVRQTKTKVPAPVSDTVAVDQKLVAHFKVLGIEAVMNAVAEAFPDWDFIANRNETAEAA